MRGNVRTLKKFAPISNIVAIGHADFDSERCGRRRKRGMALQIVITVLVILRMELSFKFNLSKETHIMDSKSNTALVIAVVIAALLLLLFGGGMATGTMFSGGMMGSGSMGGISWMWLPTLLVVVLGVALFSAISGKK